MESCRFLLNTFRPSGGVFKACGSIALMRSGERVGKGCGAKLPHPDLIVAMSPPDYPLLPSSEVPDLWSGQNGKEQRQSMLEWAIWRRQAKGRELIGAFT